MVEEFAKNTNEENKEYVWNYCFQTELEKIVTYDLMNNNPDILFEEYKAYYLCFLVLRKKESIFINVNLLTQEC